MKRRYLWAPALVLSLPAALLSQTTAFKVVPPVATSQFGGFPEGAPFTQGAARMQQIIRGSEFCKVSASISSIALRRSQKVKSPQAGLTLQNLVVTMAQAKVPPHRMIPNFAQNMGANATTVVSGKFAMPNLLPSQPATAWPVVWPLKTPFVYLRSLGDLLVDIDNRDIYNFQGYRYELDAMQVSPGGKAAPLGFSECGELPGTTRCAQYEVNSSGGFPNLGATLNLDVFDLPKAYPSFAVLGVSKTKWNGANLPLSLVPFGAARHNYLQVSMDLTVPMTSYFRTVPPYSNRHAGRLSLTIPNQAGLAGARLYTQAYVVAGAAALPVSTTRAWQIDIGSGPVMQAMHGWFLFQNGAPFAWFDGSSTRGQPKSYGGLVMRLGGVFK